MSTFFYAILPLVLAFSSFFNIIGSHDFSSIEERISSTALIRQFDSHIKSSAISCSTKSVLDAMCVTLNRLTPEQPNLEIPDDHSQPALAKSLYNLQSSCFEPNLQVAIAEAAITADKHQYGW